METFIERERFRGTCYKSADWIFSGEKSPVHLERYEHQTMIETPTEIERTFSENDWAATPEPVRQAYVKLVRRLLRELDSLWLFLAVAGPVRCLLSHRAAVDPTNNRAERVLRFGVLWRKRSQGTRVDKRDRWVERILSLRQTARLICRGLPKTKPGKILTPYDRLPFIPTSPNWQEPSGSGLERSSR